MVLYSARSLLLRVLISCLVAATACCCTDSYAAESVPRLSLHSRVRTEMEVLEDYLIGIDESNYGMVI